MLITERRIARQVTENVLCTPLEEEIFREAGLRTRFVGHPLVDDLAASARVREYRVTMSLFGTLDNLNANFASDPPLADLEVLSLLTTGETNWRGTRSSQSEGETEAAMRLRENRERYVGDRE